MGTSEQGSIRSVAPSKPQNLQWGYASLHQTNCWGKSEQPCVGNSGPGSAIGYGRGLLLIFPTPPRINLPPFPALHLSYTCPPPFPASILPSFTVSPACGNFLQWVQTFNWRQQAYTSLWASTVGLCTAAQHTCPFRQRRWA